jgi:hypothetical protein
VPAVLVSSRDEPIERLGQRIPLSGIHTPQNSGEDFSPMFVKGF